MSATTSKQHDNFLMKAVNSSTNTIQLRNKQSDKMQLKGRSFYSIYKTNAKYLLRNWKKGTIKYKNKCKKSY